MRTGDLSREYAMCQLMRASRTSNYITTPPRWLVHTKICFSLKLFVDRPSEIRIHVNERKKKKSFVLELLAGFPLDFNPLMMF